MIETIGSLITTMFHSFTDVITNLAGGLKNAFANIIYVDPSAASPTLSPLVIFVFVMAGVGLGAGILYKIFGMVRARKG